MESRNKRAAKLAEIHQKIMKAAFEEKDLKVARIMFAEKVATDLNPNEWLRKAVILDSQDLVELCVEYGAADLNGALKIAAANGNIPIAKYLIEIGANVTEQTVRIAKENGHRGTAKYLAMTKSKK